MKIFYNICLQFVHVPKFDYEKKTGYIPSTQIFQEPPSLWQFPPGNAVQPFLATRGVSGQRPGNEYHTCERNIKAVESSNNGKPSTENGPIPVAHLLA